MVPKTILAVTLLFAVAFAGCSGGSDDGVPEDADVPVPSEFQGAGAIRGVVLTEETLPVEGVQVAISEASVERTTGPDGVFSFTNLAAGKYTIFASKLGFMSKAQSVDLGEGEEAQLQFILEAVLVEETFADVIGPYQGFVTCAYTRPGVSGVTGSITYNCNNGVFEDLWGEQNNVLEFELKQENVQGVVGEMRWTQAAVGTSERFALFFTHEDGYGGDWWCMSGGQSPVQFVYHVDDAKVQCDAQGSGTDGPPNMDHTLHVTAFLPFDSIDPSDPPDGTPVNVAFQQHYESIVTVFYGMDPVLPYTAFPDA